MPTHGISAERPSTWSGAARLRQNMDAVRRHAEALLLSSRVSFPLGPNKQVEEIAAEVGLDPASFCTVQVVTHNRSSCLLLLSAHVQRSTADRQKVLEVQSAAAALDHHVLIVPEDFIRKRARSDGSVASRTLDYEINGTDRTAILQHLLENGSSRLSTLAGLLRHPDPVGAVLHLVTTGILDIDLDAPIFPTSQVRFSNA